MRKTLFAGAAAFGLMMAGKAFAQGMTPEQYLSQARQAVQQHRTMTALTAINNAENELLKSGVADEDRGARDVGKAEPAVIRQMARAREAVQMHHWKQAETYLSDAMAHPSASSATNGAAGSTGTVGSQQQ